MKLLTYCFLTSKMLKGVSQGYPLKLHVAKQDTQPTEFNADFILRLLPRVEWPVVYEAAKKAECVEDLPETLPDNLSEQPELLKKIHYALLEVNIIEGELECPESGRMFPITDGVPNMLLLEDEVSA